MSLRLEDLPEPLRREAEEFDRRGRRDARISLVFGVVVVVAFLVSIVSLFMILMAGR